MFFNKRKAKHLNKVRLSDMDSIVMQTEGMHFEFFPKNQLVKYRNVISPRDGSMNFPDGYFCVKTATISQDTMNLFSSTFNQMLSSRKLEKDLEPLPDGAAAEAYMRMSYLGNTAYYTNTHTTKDGFLETEPVAIEFSKLIQLLKQYCSFPNY